MKSIVVSRSITPRVYSSLDKYFKELGSIHLISVEEEVSLAQRIRQNDKQAWERLVTANLRFVISVAKQYTNQGLDFEDLINEGNIGLMAAAARFDETRGFRFISYAVWWIRQSITSAIFEHARIVRLPYNKLNQTSKLYKAWHYLEQEYARAPTAMELAENLELNEALIIQLLNSAPQNAVSIDEPLSGNAGQALIDIIYNDEFAADKGAINEAVTTEIRHSMRFLSNRDRELLSLFYGIGHFSPLTLEEIGDRFNITKEHAGRLKEAALAKLRKCASAPLLRSCLC